MKHGLHLKKKPNADGRYFLVDEDGIKGADDKPPSMFQISATEGLPIMSDLECERFLIIPPGQKRTVCVAPLCGVCNSGTLWPLPPRPLSALSLPCVCLVSASSLPCLPRLCLISASSLPRLCLDSAFVSALSLPLALPLALPLSLPW